MDELLVATDAIADQLEVIARTASGLRTKAMELENVQLAVMLTAAVGQLELAVVGLRMCVADARRDL